MKNFCLDTDILEVAQGLGDLAQDLAGKTIILTGARGFLGRYFTAVFDCLNRQDLDKPVTVVALDNLITAGAEGRRIPEQANFRLIEHDVIRPFAWDGPVDYIIHAAGIASPYYYRVHPLETVEVAVSGTRHMLELARAKGARLTFFSSSEIYGDPDPAHVPTPESYRGNVACQGPRACYDESKRVGETLCYIFHDSHGVATTVVRPFNVYGPGMQETDYRVLPNFGNRIKAGLPLNVYGSGNQTRTFCYVTDALIGFLQTVLRGAPGNVYNIGNPTPEIAMVDLIETLEDILGRKLPYNVIEYPDSYPADEPQRRCPDIHKARLQLGFAPKVGLKEGLARFIGWTDENYEGTV